MNMHAKTQAELDSIANHSGFGPFLLEQFHAGFDTHELACAYMFQEHVIWRAIYDAREAERSKK